MPLAKIIADSFERYIPLELRTLENPQRDLPQIAKTPSMTAQIESALESIETTHDLYLRDSREMDFLQPGSVHLVLTSPPYWTLKEYNESETPMPGS